MERDADLFMLFSGFDPLSVKMEVDEEALSLLTCWSRSLDLEFEPIGLVDGWFGAKLMSPILPSILYDI